MNSKKSGTNLLKNAYNLSIHSVAKNPRLFIPFIIFFSIELLALIGLYLAPRMPFKLVLGPLISVKWGEGFLHYPANFFLLPKLASLSRMVLTVIFGSLLTGMAVGIFGDIYQKRKLKLKESFKTALRRYIELFAVVLIFTGIAYSVTGAMRLGLEMCFDARPGKLLFLSPGVWQGPILVCVSFIFGILIQSAFVYVIPLLIIEKEKLLVSIKKSFILFKNLFIPTIIAVGLPMILYVPIIVLTYNTVFLVYEVFPELVLIVTLLGVFISSLIIDPAITMLTTFLFLGNRDNR